MKKKIYAFSISDNMVELKNNKGEFIGNLLKKNISKYASDNNYIIMFQGKYFQ